MSEDHFWNHRTACDVLEEVRACCKTLNFAPVPGLIEELQTAYNRMESGLAQSKDLVKIDKELHKKKEEYRKIKADVYRQPKDKSDLKDAIKKQQNHLSVLNRAIKEARKELRTSEK